MGRIYAYAAGVDRAMSKELNWNSLASAVYRLSPLLLENIGIRVDMRALPSADLYTTAQEFYFGSGCLGRFYARNIRQFIAPKMHEEASRTWQQAKTTLRQELINAVLEKGQESIDER